jgi:hypothetical protein
LALRPTRPLTLEEQKAAKAAADGDAFLREVDDALREDTAMLMLRRYGKPVGAGLAIGLAALGGYLWWGSHQQDLAAGRAEQAVIALDQVDAGQEALANKTLDALASGDGAGTAAIAKLVEAGLLAKQGKDKDAAVRYGAVAADASVPQPYRDLATLRQVALSFDAMKPEEVVAKLKPLAAPGNPWFGSAGELLGMAYIKQGKKDLAGPLFGAIAKDKDQSESLRARTRQMAGLLGFDAVEDIAKAAEAPAGEAVAAAPAAAAAASAAQ